MKYESLGQNFNRKLRLAEDPAVEVAFYEQAGKTLPSTIKTFRQHWLGSKVK